MDFKNTISLVTVSLAMVIKDEEEILEQCLNTVRDIVDEIVIIDIGSKDNSIAIAKKFTEKVFSYNWENNFSKAKNYSIKNCTKDWILFMNANDYFYDLDKEKFLELVNCSEREGHFFIIKSYRDLNDKKNYSTSLDIRLIKNKNRYEFVGAIHEQLIEKRSKILDMSLFSIEDILIENKNYSNEFIKFNKEQFKDREEIMNFDLAEEYFLKADYESALNHYILAYNDLKNKKDNNPKLLYKIIICCKELGRYKEAVDISNKLLEIYPDFVEVYYIKALVYEKERKYTMAIENYKKAIEIEESNVEVDIDIDIDIDNGLEVFNSFRALGKIYKNFKDYNRATEYFKRAIENSDNKLEDYYNFAYCFLKKIGNGKDFLKALKEEKIEGENLVNSLIVAKLLIEEGFLEAGIELLENFSELKLDHYYFLKGKAFFYQGNFKEAREILKEIEESSIYYDERKTLEILSFEISLDKKDKYDFHNIKDYDIKILLKNLISLKAENKENIIEMEGESLVKKAIEILENILKTKNFDYFQKSLELLNYIKSENILCELAKLYYRNGYEPLAKKELLNSLKVFEKIDEESYWIFLSSL